MNTIISIPEDVKFLMNCLLISGHEVYVAGGAVRDALQGLAPSDWDLTTSATGEQILNVFPHGTVTRSEDGGHILTVIVNGVEISPYRKSGNRLAIGKHVKDDVFSRDFTINSLIADKHGIVYDYTDGLLDLKDNLIQFVGSARERILEDPLRILRALRFECYGYELSTNAFKACCDNFPLVYDIPIERHMKELMKAFTKKKPSVYLNRLHFLGWIDRMIPELGRLNNYIHKPENHPEGNPLEHTFKAVDDCEVPYRLSMLFHDIGKGVDGIPQWNDGYHTFFGHDKAGADLIPEVFKRLKLSNEEAREAEIVALLHMRGHEAKTPAAIRRLQSKANGHLDAVRAVCMADATGRKEFNEKAFIPLLEKEVRHYAVDGEFLVSKGYKAPSKELGC